MKKIYFVIKFSLLFVGIAPNAQVIEGVRSPDIIPPSPTVANLMNFEEVPIDHYTGQPDISIPIYSKSMGGGLSLPIVLKYSTQSLKLDSHSGWTGTGWSLDAGGVISRTVRGHADETMKGITGNVTGVFHNDKFWNFENLSYYEMNEVLWNVDGTTMDKFDSQPDLFQISMPGFSGRFLIIKEGGAFKARQLDMAQNVKIDVTWGTNRVINGFTITDANGYKYLFGIAANTIETSVTTSTTVIKPRDFPQTPVSVDNKTLPVCNTAWMLTSITTSNDEVLASFIYENSEETYKTGETFTNNDFINPQSFPEVMRNHSYNAGQFLPISTLSHNTIITQTKKLSKITFRDKTALAFTLSAQGSHPENAGKYLTKIELTKFTSPNDEVVRTYNLSYHTTPRNRLFLTGVKSGSDFSHDLDYYQMDNFDAVNDPVDNWGYTSGDHRADNTGAYGFNEYDKLAIQKGVLTAINSPGGGRKEFSWEHHTFSYEGAAKLTDFTDNPDNVNENIFTHAFDSNMSGAYVLGQNITIGFDQYIQLEKSILPGSNADPSKFQVEFIDIITNQLAKLIKVSELTKKVSILPGTYRVQVRLNVLATTSDDDYIKGYINVRYLVKKLPHQYKHHNLGGGLRIAAITFTEKNNNDFNKRTFNYRYTINDYDTILRDSIVMSSGAVDLKTGLKAKTYYFTDKKYLFVTESTDTHQYQHLVPYKISTNQSNLMVTRGGYVGYKRVAVTEGLSVFGGNSLNGATPNGYTEYFYTNAVDTHYDPGVYTYPFVEKPNLDHKRGLLTRKRIFNKDGIKLEETVNTYDVQELYVSRLFTVTQEPCVWTQCYDTYEHFVNKTADYLLGFPLDWYENCYGDSAFPTAFDWHITNMYATSSKLKKSINKQYFSTGQPVTKTTEYTYDINNYQLATQVSTFTEGSETVTLKTEYQYPVGGYNIDLFDNTEEGAITAMANNYNMVNMPVVIYSYRNGALLNTVVNKYKLFATNQILLGKVQTLKGELSNGTPEDRLIYHGYNAIGNVTDVSMAGGLRTCYVWGYYDTLPVAKIDNCTTGYASLNQTRINSIKSASAAGNDSAIVSALSDFRSYYSLQNVHITTILHHPVFGVLSITDPKSLQTSFGYDYLGRLLWTKDTEGNLINEYKYHFKRTY